MGIMKQQPTGPGCLSCTLDSLGVQGSTSGKYRDATVLGERPPALLRNKT